MIHVIASSRFVLPRKLIKEVCYMLLIKHGFTENHILNIVFVGKTKMKQIASQYKHENEALPVLSFSYIKDQDKSNLLIGEIFICYPQLVLLAAERQKKVDVVLFDLIKHGFQNILNE